MKRWEELTRCQKAAFWFAIGIVGWFAPEIALLFQFGGIEVVFAFSLIYFLPVFNKIKAYVHKCKDALTIAYLSYRTSASAQPRVFAIQAAFCCVAFMLTGSLAFSTFFLMPGMLFNGALT